MGRGEGVYEDAVEGKNMFKLFHIFEVHSIPLKIN